MPNFTAVAPVKLVPVIITVVPAMPVAGVKLVILGSTLKFVALVAVPAALTMLSLPVVAPTGTSAAIDVAETTVKFVALMPLNLTAAAPLKLVPVIVTLVPTAPLAGVKEVIVGGLTTTNMLALVAVPPGVITVIVPVAADAGTVVVIWLSELTVKVAVIAPNFTAVVPVNELPVIVTLVPAMPARGVKLVIFGNTEKLLKLVAVPAPLLTESLPVVAPVGTVAVIEVAETILNTALVPLNLTVEMPL
jgi:hypothetical protein